MALATKAYEEASKKQQAEAETNSEDKKDDNVAEAKYEEK